MEIQNKTFVVTGAGSGLGRELTLELLARGGLVAAADINEAALSETKNLAAENATKLSTHVLDITDNEAVMAFPEQVVASHGQVDILINNAGIIQPFVKVKNLELEVAERVMRINFNGCMYMTKAFLPVLLKRPQAMLVNVSSMGSFFSVPGQTIYGASKAAVSQFTRGLATELVDTNCHVALVTPGAMNTNIFENSGQKMNPEMEKMQGQSKILSPQKAAQIIIRGIELNRKNILVGNDAKFLNALNRFAPGLTTQIFTKLVGSKLVMED